MRKALLAILTLVSLNAYSCELGETCIGSPNISTQLPSNHQSISVMCHLWSYHSGQFVNLTAKPGDNVQFDTRQLNHVNWYGKDILISANYIDSSKPANIIFTNDGTGKITSECRILNDLNKA